MSIAIQTLALDASCLTMYFTTDRIVAVFPHTNTLRVTLTV
jgi:hypothetical protein